MEQLGEIAAIFRYPVKSLAGERLESAQIELAGIPGDRASAFFFAEGDRAGKIFRGTDHNLLHTVAEPAQAMTLARERGVATEIREGEHFFDAAPISLLFDSWVEEVSAGLGEDLDFMRFRPNLFARANGDFRYSEADFTGAIIDVGNARLRVREPNKRCVTPTYDIETGAPNPEVLAYIARERDKCVGLYCDVELAGVVRIGDALRLRAR